MIAWLGPADFPEHRRDTLLRRLAWEAGTDEPAALAVLTAARAAQPCRVLTGSVAVTPPIAVLGDDGRYHLRLGTRYLCARTWRGLKKPPPPALPHEQWCKWWSADGQHYRVNPPPGTRPEEGRCGNRTVRWPVLALGSETDPALVRRRERCPVEQDSARWPPFQGPVLGPIIRALIAALGPACHACHSTIGVFVDHDPAGLQVRGLLCRHCNTWLETCPHPAGCAWGDYLNNPPAAYLGLTYPRAAISRKPR
ncbi:endonuclease domain-containing protein [Nonomuraea sp. JJY05]|uniref:endonuclease domain-containing protein n=1 Tax=Nonomuraea sp. JJY05 TaxID=3350255 RepID=UPI00373ECA9D